MNAESIILDIDGTLWDSRALVAEGFNLQLTEEGLAHLCTDADTLTALFGKVLEPIADALFGEIPAPERYRLMERCNAREQAHMRQNPCDIAFPGVKDTLEKLAKNHRLFIVSNSEAGYPERCMEKMGIAHLIRGHLCYGDTGRPKGETIRILMERNNIRSAVYVGDTQGDREACLAAGIPFIYAAYGFGSPDGWDARIGAFPELLSLAGGAL